MDFTWTTEQLALAKAVRSFAEAEFTATAFAAERPPDFVRDRARLLAEHGFLGITFPTADGGQGGGLLDAIIVLREIARVCPHSGDVVQAYNFGAIRQVQELVGERGKERWLAPALRGDVLMSLAMSEPEAGSGLTAMRTTARYDGDSVVINGSKIFATHGVDADLVVVWCRFGPEPDEIGVVIVPATAPGFQRDRAETFMSGERYCQMHFDDCRLPRDHVLVDRHAIRRMMPIFNVERLGNATRALALAGAAFDMARRHATVRGIGDVLLKDLQGIRWKFADMRMRLDAAELLVLKAAAGGEHPGDEATAIAKVTANEAAFFVADQSLQIFGGAGYSTEFPLEYIFRRVRGWMIAGGSPEVLRNRIATNIFRGVT